SVGSGLYPTPVAYRAAAFRTVPTPVLVLHNAEQRLALFSELRQHWQPPVPLPACRRVGARSMPAAAHAPIAGLSSASPQPAGDPSSVTGHAHDGRFACLHYGVLFVIMKVTQKVHLYTVKDLDDRFPYLPQEVRGETFERDALVAALSALNYHVIKTIRVESERWRGC